MKIKIVTFVLAITLFTSPLFAEDFFNPGTLIGSITGGLLANQIGKGSGKTVATAVGVLVGSQAGNWLYNKPKETQNSDYKSNNYYRVQVNEAYACDHIFDVDLRSACLSGVADRMRHAQLEAKDRAYKCGYYGQCY